MPISVLVCKPNEIALQFVLIQLTLSWANRRFHKPYKKLVE
jgi:hypothetical protein